MSGTPEIMRLLEEAGYSREEVEASPLALYIIELWLSSVKMKDAEIGRLRAHIETLMEKKARKLNGQGDLLNGNGEENPLRGMIRKDDHDTSIKAAKKIERNVNRLMKMTYDVLVQHPAGLNDEDLRLLCEEAYGKHAECTWRRRREELTKAGCVAWTGIRNLNKGNNTMKVWAVTAPLPAKHTVSVKTKVAQEDHQE